MLKHLYLLEEVTSHFEVFASLNPLLLNILEQPAFLCLRYMLKYLDSPCVRVGTAHLWCSQICLSVCLASFHQVDIIRVLEAFNGSVIVLLLEEFYTLKSPLFNAASFVYHLTTHENVSDRFIKSFRMRNLILSDYFNYIKLLPIALYRLSAVYSIVINNQTSLRASDCHIKELHFNAELRKLAVHFIAVLF